MPWLSQSNRLLTTLGGGAVKFFFLFFLVGVFFFLGVPFFLAGAFLAGAFFFFFCWGASLVPSSSCRVLECTNIYVIMKTKLWQELLRNLTSSSNITSYFGVQFQFLQLHLLLVLPACRSFQSVHTLCTSYILLSFCWDFSLDIHLITLPSL